MILKLLLAALLLYVIFNLFKGLFTMIKGDPEQPPMSFYIGRRLVFSVLAIVIILLALATGIITPNPRPY
ncbi:DUF2909 domain-containing protein [Aliidiomarina minuta]|uniref:DUF2909 domain-containing protein n=1 Tax=Aliidiomarina minuta TaxID=880057 RepID=A0A432WC19_9GAMM|nr:DUF2909 domain-containing protein [Aliidiomarina minuta]RUO27148.1 DUF2909 domain-containing protein [Aliidiomarina minuta]